MAKAGETLGELELEVLKVVWETQPCTVREVADVMARRRGSARTTVLTVMQRLTGKRYLARRKQGGVHRYSTTAERRAVMREFIERFVKRVLDGSPAPFVAYLAESGDLTAEQAAALRAIARELRDQAEEEKP